MSQNEPPREEEEHEGHQEAAEPCSELQQDQVQAETRVCLQFDEEAEEEEHHDVDEGQEGEEGEETEEAAPSTPQKQSKIRQKKNTPKAHHEDEAVVRDVPTRGLLAKWLARTVTLPVEQVHIDRDCGEGQTRKIKTRHVEDIIGQLMRTEPVEPRGDLIIWQAPTGKYWVIGGQHWVAALRKYRPTWTKRHGEKLPEWLTHVRCYELRGDTPLDVRENIAGDSNARSSTVKMSTHVDVADTYVRKKRDDKTWQENLLAACQKQGLVRFYQTKYLQEKGGRHGQLQNYADVDWKTEVCNQRFVCSIFSLA